jgi:hypothetical protein
VVRVGWELEPLDRFIAGTVKPTFSGSRALPKRFEPLVERSTGARHIVAGSSDDGALGFQLALEQIANALENLIVAA